MSDTHDFTLYTQGPSGTTQGPLAAVVEAAQLADQFGYTGMLLFYNHLSLDPWLLASALIHHTRQLVPLVALQPNATPPMTAAKMVRTFADLYGRRVDINLIAGADPRELAQIGDALPHDARYARATEYVQVLRGMIGSNEPFSFSGAHYRLDRLAMNACVEPLLRPRFFVAGSSPAGQRAAESIADVTVTHPEPIDSFVSDFVATVPHGVEVGVRIGILARSTADEAWREARARYPVDRAAVIRTRLKQQSQSEWSRRLAVLAAAAETHDGVYWTGAFASGRSSFPLLVGDYEQVGAYLGGYLAAGARTLLVAGLGSRDDFVHANRVFKLLRAEDSRALARSLGESE